jgi:hypothetical protein
MATGGIASIAVPVTELAWISVRSMVVRSIWAQDTEAESARASVRSRRNAYSSPTMITVICSASVVVSVPSSAVLCIMPNRTYSTGSGR